MNVLSLFDGISCGQVALNDAKIAYEHYFASEIDKYAIKVTQDNFPQTIQLGDVQKIKSSDLPKIDLILAGSPCFAAGSLVLTENGYIPIEDLRVGDKVLTHKLQWQKILNIGSTFKSTIEIKSQGSVTTTTTPEHPYYFINIKQKWSASKNKYEKFYSNPSWKPVNNFLSSDRCLSFKWPIIQDKHNFSLEKLYILGRFLADGYCLKIKRKNRKNSYRYHFVVTMNKTELEDFKQKTQNHQFSYIEERTTYKAFLYSKEWVELGEKFGKYAKNKFIPNFILDLPIEKLKIFLDGYMDGDGSKRPNNFKRASTISAKLALTLSLAIQKCYNSVAIQFCPKNPTTVIEERTVNQYSSYEITYTEINNKALKPIQLTPLIAYNLKVHKNNLIQTKVYNIEVEEDNSYIVNNLIVHNCMGFSHGGNRLGFLDPRSKLYWEFSRLLKELKPKWFLLENAAMRQDWQDIISVDLGLTPISINSNLVSAQNRKRLYWTNIPVAEIPKDKGIKLPSIIGVNTGIWKRPRGKNKGGINVEKSPALTSSCWQHNFLLYSLSKNAIIGQVAPWQCEALQTIPINYTNAVSKTQRYRLIGSAWTVDVISHILGYIPK